MELIISFLSFLLAIGSFFYTYHLNKQNKLEQEVLRLKANRLEVDSMYEKVRNKRIEFEEILNDYVVIELEHKDIEELDASKQKLSELLLKSKTKYNAFYNEIEAFCSRVVDGTINSESYFKNEVLPSLKKDAIRQAQFFGILNLRARDLDLPPIPKPEPSAFKNYNIIIKTFFGDDYEWLKELERERNENSFLY